ncbi:MAG: RNA-binding protein [Candidatus Marinimicrobia bacterium]|nr:RNA-binding protein [Candidatus Neomarinimicrobiota bacterium]
MMNVYIDNLSHADISEDLRKAFEVHGHVASVTIITDVFDGKHRGFGIIEMSNEEEARAAISALNGNEVAGHRLELSDRRAIARRSGKDRRHSVERQNEHARRTKAERRN